MKTLPGDVLGMADDDFLKLNGPPAAEAAGEIEQKEEGAPDQVVTQPDQEQGEKSPEGQEDKDPAADADQEGDEADEGEGAGEKSKEGDNLLQDKSQEQGEQKPAETKDKDGNPIPGSKEKEAAAPTPPNYEEFYNAMMTPFTANGKKIELKSPEEAVQLMKMGANYTRKMQAIAPHRKILLMLENNKLLDEGKLSFLIDIEKKNPEAIKKLIKDSGIDPLEIDTTQDSTYREGNHRVSDEEAGFRAALDELSSNPEGRETLKLINTQWDQASKEILWKQPEVMTLIQQQRESGIYDLITTELERQRTLGAIPPTVAFLHAYKKIGDELQQTGAFAHLAPAAETKPQPSLVATRKAAPKAPVVNGDKANAASTSRTSSRKADTVVNPLALSDEEFEKQFSAYQGRV